MLKKFLFLIVFILVGAAICVAAQKQMEFSNKWFKLILPPGWEEIKAPDRAPPIDGLNLMLANKEKNCFVSFAVAKGITSAKQAADNAVAQMKANKVKFDGPEKVDNLYKVSMVRAQTQGTAYFGSNGTYGTFVTMFGDATPALKELFANFKPVDPAMFPKF